MVLPFTDVSSDHWAYQALLNLAGTYSCLSGYPDGTFRGEATVTRYEFSAGMDACMGVLTGPMEQRQGEDRQAVEALIESMQQSLDELRQVGGESTDSP
ncbi:MAG: S-layer homology domain-containing protein [Leptolyngbyaceae cyanobacterium SM2_3_12]|nr:S-layer homology domain-containing protein [Leptolyngbyaceae cyanobacterium SM2_3_12]